MGEQNTHKQVLDALAVDICIAPPMRQLIITAVHEVEQGKLLLAPPSSCRLMAAHQLPAN